MTLFGFEITPALLVLGAIQGMTYGILAVGLLLVYRTSRVINFAHGEIGAFGAAVCGLLVTKWHVPYWLAFASALVTSATVAAIAEVVVVRRLRAAPKLMSLVATLGVAQFLLFLSAAVNVQARSGTTFPGPVGLPEFKIGVLLVTQAYSAMLLISPIIVIALVLFLRRSRYGLALRAASANEERARMAGISAGRTSVIAWAIAGAIGAFTAVLLLPTKGNVTTEALGPDLLLRALAPVVLARMSSLPIALGAGVVLGIVDQVLIYNSPTSGVSEVALLAIIVGAILFLAPRHGRLEEKQDWSVLQPWPTMQDAFRKVWAIRNLGTIVAALGLALAALVGLFASNNAAVTLTAIVAFALIGLSLGIVTGLGGQLSLGQFAIAGVGATVSYHVVNGVGGHILGVFAAGFAAGAVSLVIGLPALRVRGLLLGVITLSFALAAKRWFLTQTWALGSGVQPGRPDFAQSSRSYYYWALVVLLLGIWLARNVWRGGVGLRLRATRDNEDGARAFAIPPAAVKLQGFVLAGVLAGFAGAIYAHLLAALQAGQFEVSTSINSVALTILGGIGILAGPILGALYIIGLPRFLPLDSAGLAATALGWLLLILYFPGGVAQLVAGPRRLIVHLLARRNGLDPKEIEASAFSEEGAISGNTIVLGAARDEVRAPDSDTLLKASGLVKHFGGVKAVDGVDVTVSRNEVLGIIGPNGAGKTSLFELLSGFTKADEGTVEFEGRDVSGLTADRRSRLGLIRSFQDCALFPTLTVLEAVTLSLERVHPTNVLRSCLGSHAPERAKRDYARLLISMMGLDPFRNKQIRELSTGTRRIAELSCMVALRPKVLLLDEPSAGIAQRESEALGNLLVQLREHLGCSLVIIEHDIPLLMELSSRVVAMDTGRVICEGTPKQVQSNPHVVTSYLGGDIRAIHRSGLGVAQVRS